MKYELHKLKSLIEKYCYGKIEVSSEEYEILKKDIEIEGFRIKDALIDNYFAINNKYQFKKYIRRHQIGIIRLLDSVFLKLNQSELSDINKLENSNPKINIKNLLYIKLDSLLSFIESYFSSYFDQEDMIPKRYQYIAKNEFKRKLNIENDFNKQKTSCSLISIAASPLDEFIKSRNKISFRQLIYLKKLLNVIIKTCHNCLGDCKECSMQSKLIYLNFNSYRFFSLLTNQIKTKCQEQETINQQIEILCYHLKKINQSQEKPGFIYKQDLKSLKDQLSMWLVEEISFLEKKQELYNNPSSNQGKSFINDFKITTECSVSQVAYLIRLLVDAGAITNKNQREIINFFASCLRTKKAENISPESLRTKYYHVENSTIDAVKDLIIKMLNKIHNDR